MMTYLQTQTEYIDLAWLNISPAVQFWKYHPCIQKGKIRNNTFLTSAYLFIYIFLERMDFRDKKFTITVLYEQAVWKYNIYIKLAYQFETAKFTLKNRDIHYWLIL